jgi:hypothetical protein
VKAVLAYRQVPAKDQDIEKYPDEPCRFSQATMKVGFPVFKLTTDDLPTVQKYGHENVYDSHRDTSMQNENAGGIFIGNSSKLFSY